jgi:cytochrome c peroxidase
MRRSMSSWRRALAAIATTALLTACSESPTRPLAIPDGAAALSVGGSPAENLGKELFFDTDLSINKNQSCASCHDPAWGWTGPLAAINAGGSVYEGSIAGRFGDRKPPSSAYATISPVFHRDRSGLFVGGNFWDGRATGAKLGNAAADQAQGPFLNPVEQALPDPACVVYRVSQADYAGLYASVWGGNLASIVFPPTIDSECAAGNPIALDAATRAKVNTEYDNIALAIAAFEGSAESNAYSSKFDAWRRGRASLTKEEVKGWALFNGKGKCADCHPPRGPQPAFTDFTFDNLGVPKNPSNPVYGGNPGFIDYGLGGFLATQPSFGPAGPEMGKHKVPTLRNVDLRPYPTAVKAYTHNGVFKSLQELVHFYNTRDVLPRCEVTPFPVFGVNCWPAPEVLQNMNTAELGNLGLSLEEERALVAFMRTLSDGFVGR